MSSASYKFINIFCLFLIKVLVFSGGRLIKNGKPVDKAQILGGNRLPNL